MKKFLALIVGLLATMSSAAYARDSSWVVCENDSLVVNALEHRAAGDARSTSYALIFGARILRGEQVEPKTSASLIEDARAKTPSTFKGTIVMSPDMSKVALKGAFVLDGQLFQTLDVTLACQGKNND